MKTPGAINYLLGNPVSVALLLLFAGNMGYAWYVDRAGGHLPGFAFSLFAATLALQSAKQLKLYRQWNKQWNTMASLGPESAATSRSRRKWGLALCGVLAVIFSLAWLGDHAGDRNSPASGFVALGLVIALLSGFGWLCFRLWRGIQRAQARLFPKTAERMAEDLVTVCLPVPKAAHRPADPIALLPDYCRRLLNAQRDAPSGNQRSG